MVFQIVQMRDNMLVEKLFGGNKDMQEMINVVGSLLRVRIMKELDIVTSISLIL